MKRFDSKQIMQIKEMRVNGYSHSEIASKFRTSKSTIFYHTSNTEVSPNGKKRLKTLRRMVSVKAGFRRRYKIPERSKKITKAKARIIAHLLGDGGVYKNQICYRNSEPRLIEQFIHDFLPVYGVRPWKKYWDENKFATGSGIVEVIRDLHKYANKKEFPIEIINANKAIQKEFIRAFSDDEGGPMSRNRIRITSTNRSYLNSMSKMLKNFEIQSVINGPYHRGEYLLDINRKESVLEYIRQIGFLHPQKVIKVKQIVALLSKNI